MALEKFSADMLAPLKGRIGRIHVQTIEVHPGAQETLKLSDGTEVYYERVDCNALPTFIDFSLFPLAFFLKNLYNYN